MQPPKEHRAKGRHDPRYEAMIASLKAKRKAVGLTQIALASRLRRHQQFVSRYETGERRLDVVELVDVARALECDPAEIVAQIP